VRPLVNRRWFAAAPVVAAVLVASSAASAKEFRPGDLRVCGATRCVAVMDPGAARGFGAFIYLGRRPAVAGAPRLGATMYRLRFSNDYVPGIVAGARRDRFLSYGVYLERFQRGHWYRIPPGLARHLRTLTAPLRPARVTRAAVKRSR
jgi:hypothetical protein